MSWPRASKSGERSGEPSSSGADTDLSGAGRDASLSVRPAVFRSLQAEARTQAPTALRAYRPAAEGVPLSGVPGGGDPSLLSAATETRQTRGGGEKSSEGVVREARSPRAGLSTPAPASSPEQGSVTSRSPEAPRSGEALLEEQLTPLRGISRELVTRGLPASLVAELLAETVAEFGAQVLASERDARLALVEQLLLRIPEAPLVRPGELLTGTYVITGPAGAGKSVLIAHLALAAATQGQRDVVIVNTESSRIGAAAQANALGMVFGYDVEHIYTPQELRTLRTRRGPDTVLLVETAGWSPRDGLPGETPSPQPWKWGLRGPLGGATMVVCVPATGQGDDLAILLDTTRQMANGAVAALCKTSETRNVLPALGALAALRQPLGMVVPGPNLLAGTAPGSPRADSVGCVPPQPSSLAEIARAALGVVVPQRKKGRAR